MKGVIAPGGEHSIDVYQVLHARHFGADDDPLVWLPDPLREGGGAHSAFHDGLERDVPRVPRIGPLGVGVHQLGEQQLIERAPVHPDAHRLLMAQRDLDDRPEVLVRPLSPDVPGVDPVLG